MDSEYDTKKPTGLGKKKDLFPFPVPPLSSPERTLSIYSAE